LGTEYDFPENPNRLRQPFFLQKCAFCVESWGRVLIQLFFLLCSQHEFAIFAAKLLFKSFPYRILALWTKTVIFLVSAITIYII
jgi:hypothetical protein